MTKLVFGVCGVGIGHAMRMKVLLKELEKRHDILILASNFPYEFLRKYFKNKVINIGGLELAFKENRIINYRTLLLNIGKISLNNYKKLKEAREKIRKFNPNVFFSDMETFVCLVAKEMNKPLVSIGNQHYTIYGDFKVRKKDYVDYLKARGIIKTLVPSPDYSVITFFEEVKLKEDNKRFLTQPIVREEILKAKPTTKDYVFVYQSTTNYNKLIEILGDINMQFIVYGYDLSKTQGNLTFKRFDDSKEFLNDLKNCKAVIANAGFTLISESLILGKPILAIPIKKHFEQKLNALYVKEKGYGEYYEDINTTNIRKFLSNLTKYKKYKTSQKNNKKIVEVVEKIIKDVT